jgi:hypothetical protein
VEIVYDVAEDGIVDIYDIPENDPFFGKLGTGRFDALSTLENTPFAAALAALSPATGRMVSVGPNPARIGELARIALATQDTGAAPAGARASVFDLLGRRVRALSRGDASGAFVWDGRDDRGTAAPPGVYFVRVEDGSGRSRSTARMVRIRN